MKGQDRRQNCKTCVIDIAFLDTRSVNVIAVPSAKSSGNESTISSFIRPGEKLLSDSVLIPRTFLLRLISELSS